MNYLERSAFFLFFCFYFVLPNQFLAQCTHPDYNALVKLYNSTDGANWKTNNGWKEGAAGQNCKPCTWSFIRCISNRVTEINFPSGTGLNGSLPKELGELTELRTLNINREPNLKGTLPSELGNLKKIKIFKIRSTGISGPIPSGIFQSNLSQLFLSRNQLSGSIPSEIGNARNLTLLFLNYNNLTGDIPDEIYTLSRATDMFINDNQLTGTVSPKIGQLQSLERMSFGANQLTGTIPEEIGSLRNLSVLKFFENKMTGTIPSSIKNLRRLNEIKINENQFSGWIIGELASLSNLTQVQMQKNQFECFDEELKKLCAKGQLKRSSFEENKNPLSWQDFCANADYPYICNVAARNLKDVLRIYPNPIENYIVLEGLDNLNVTEISIIDQLGHTVLRTAHQSNIISISDLHKGMYLLNIRAEQGVINKKILIQ